jgi:preprotein translocase subunit SecG
MIEHRPVPLSIITYQNKTGPQSNCIFYQLTHTYVISKKKKKFLTKRYILVIIFFFFFIIFYFIFIMIHGKNDIGKEVVELKANFDTSVGGGLTVL